jgi:hypothetical protein
MLQAIPTLYAGVWFRSRAEAKWAMIFDALALQWQYEVEGFELATCWYEPDFWLPGLSCFAEVKGGSWQFDVTATRKASELVRASRRPIIVCAEIDPFLAVKALVPDATVPWGYEEYECSLLESILRGALWLSPDQPEPPRSMTGKLLARIEEIRTHRFYVPAEKIA